MASRRKPDAPRDGRIGWPRIVRIAVILLLGLPLLWLSVAGTAATSSSPVVRRLAGSIGLPSSRTTSDAALALVTPRVGRGEAERIASLARAGIRVEPGHVPSLRALAVATLLRGDNEGAARIFRWIERLSRRDQTTQLWLIEHAVGRDDIPGALLHYDRIMRVSVPMRDTLFPTLRRAMEQPAVMPHLVARLRLRPAWAPWFVRSVVNDPQVSARALASLYAGLRLSPEAGDAPIIIDGLTRLATLGAGREALSLYRAAAGDARANLRLRDGDFEAEPSLPPFDWVLNDAAELAGVREEAQEGGRGTILRVIAGGVANGEAARQATALPPGRYRVSWDAGSVAGDELQRPRMVLSCAGPNGALLMERVIPVTPPEGARHSAEATVPAASCSGQWLAIAVRSGREPGGSGSGPWIDNVAIDPL